MVLVGHAYAGAVIAGDPRTLRHSCTSPRSRPTKEKQSRMCSIAARRIRRLRNSPRTDMGSYGCHKRHSRRLLHSTHRRTVGGACGGAAPHFGLLHCGSCWASAVERCSDLVSARRRRPDDHPRYPAFHGVSHECKDTAHPVDHTPMVTAPDVVTEVIVEAIPLCYGEFSASCMRPAIPNIARRICLAV